jgi:hypothetical protein
VEAAFCDPKNEFLTIQIKSPNNAMITELMRANGTSWKIDFLGEMAASPASNPYSSVKVRVRRVEHSKSTKYVHFHILKKILNSSFL